jgi:hypothetical protein
MMAATLLYALAAFWALFGCYAVVMGLRRLKLAGKMTPLLWIFGTPYLVVGLLLDVLCNVTLAALVFLELPRETLVTARLQRYMRGPDSWRKSAARWFCANALDPLDPSGQHCD